jgi:hypothetical protein
MMIIQAIGSVFTPERVVWALWAVGGTSLVCCLRWAHQFLPPLCPGSVVQGRLLHGRKPAQQANDVSIHTD